VFNASRPATQNKGKSILLKLMEIDEPTAVTKYLLTKLGDKKVKIPPTCLEVIKEGTHLLSHLLTHSLTHLLTHSLTHLRSNLIWCEAIPSEGYYHCPWYRVQRI